jgi:hypothetical protein
MAEPGPAAGQRPMIEVRETSQDGGVVEEGTVVRYHFTLANRGQADMEIQKVEPSCGCSVARWDRLIRPEAVGTVEVEMNTLHFRGRVAKHLTVVSNDPDQPRLQLTISARVTPLVQITPGSVAQLTVEEQPVTQEFTLERTGGRPMKILQVMPTASYLKTELVPLPGEGRYKVTAMVTPEAPLGRSLAVIIVRTDLQKHAEQRLTLIVHRGIVTIPPVVFWSLARGERRMPMRSVVTISRHSGSFRVTGVTSDDPRLQGKLESMREGTEYRLTVSYAGTWAAGEARKMLTVTTDDAKQPVLQIPIQAVLQPSAAEATSPVAP